MLGTVSVTHDLKVRHTSEPMIVGMGKDQQDGNFGLRFIFITTRPNLMLICIHRKDKLELMTVTLTALSFFS